MPTPVRRRSSNPRLQPAAWRSARLRTFSDSARIRFSRSKKGWPLLVGRSSAENGVVPAAAPQLILPVAAAYLVRLRRTEVLVVARRSVEYGHRPSFLSVPRGRLLRISVTTRCRRASFRPRRPLSGRRRGPSRHRRAARHRRWCEQLAVELFELLDGVGDREQPA